MTIFEQKQRAEGKLNYIKSVLNTGGLEAWEAKEYSNLASDLENEIENLNLLIEEYNQNA